MIKSVRGFFERQNLLGSRGVVAVSGGPDSVALAWLLSEFSKSGELAHLAFVHLNHQLRGDESDADEAFVKQLPTLWNVPHPRHTRRIDVKQIAQAKGLNLEACARSERYAWFIEVANA